MNGHLTDGELREFVSHRLPADRLIAGDDHLATCDDCRRRAASIGDAPARLTGLHANLLALDGHLSDEEVQQYVAGGLTSAARARVNRHIADCGECAREINDLSRWISSRPAIRRYAYVAAAAAIVLLVLVPLAMRWLPGRDPDTLASVEGLDRLPTEVQGRVRSALDAGVAEPPALLNDLAAGSETLMSGGATDAPFHLLEPLATVSVSDRPSFRWSALPKAEAYTIAVFDVTLQPAATPVTVTATTWTPPEPLARGRVYLWQVTAHANGEPVTVPAPPAAPARFSVMDGPTAAMLERASREQPQSHLILGLLYAQAGARDEAMAHLRRVPSSVAYAEVAERTMQRLRKAHD